MTVKFSNSGKALITSTVYTHSQTVDVDDASVFPSIVDYGNDYFYVTFQNPSTGNSEICKVTDVMGNKLFIERAQDGTTAGSFGAGDKCENRLNAGALIEAVNDFDITSQTDPKYLRSNTDDTTTHVLTSHSAAKWPLVIGKFVGGSHNQKIKLQGSASPNIDFCSEQHERMMFGYSSLGYGQWYVHDGDNNSARLKLDEDGTLKLTATVSADGVTSETYSDATVFHSGLFTNNATDWDTAYSWGDHADAGYLTSHQDISGKADLSGDNVFTGYVQAKGGIQTNVISGFQPPGTIYGPQQLVLNAGESYGKVSGQVGEQVYVNAENGLRVSTPDSDHANWAAGYTVKATQITGESITVSGNEVWHAGNLTNNATNWDTAYGWGNHADAGYLTAETHADAGYLTAETHADAGYLTAETHADAGYLTSHQDISGKLDKSGGTMTGQLTIEGTSPQMKFVDTGDHDDFWVHVNNNRFYVLNDRDEDGGWETPYALELNAGTNESFTFGNEIWHAGNFTDNSSNWDTAHGWGDHSGLYLGATATAADSDKLDGYHKSDINPAHSHYRWTNIKAQGTQTKRHRVMRLYGCPAHWDSNWQDIHFKVWSESYEATHLEYVLAGDYNGGVATSMYILRLKDASGSAAHSRFRLVLGDPVAAGWDHSSQPTYYVDVFAEASHYMNFTVAAEFYSAGFAKDTLPTSGGASTVVFTDPDETDIDDFTESKTDFYLADNKVWHDGNFTDNSGNWDTAYGWGDHADAGYLTSETHASAGYLTSHQDISGKLDKSGGTVTGGLTINTSNPNLIIQNNSGNGAGIKFKDIGDDTQYGNIEYFHQDGKSYGSGEAFVVRGDETHMSFVVKGKVMYEDGLWVPGTADNSTAAVRKDANWDTAYGWGDHSTAGYLTAVPSKASPATSEELGNVDLDDYGQPADAGFYHQLANADADVEDNWPNGRAGSLLVQKSANSGNFGTTQLFIDYNHSDVYVRSLYADTSADRDWKRLYTTSDFTNNASNWDTAYGWGDHSTAGYLTSHQDISGKANLSGANFTGNVARAGTGSNNTYDADTTVISGYGLIGNRSATVYVTNSNSAGAVQIGVGGAHNANSKLNITTDLASFTVPISTSGGITASGNVTAYSDERLKENIETLDGSKVYDMRGVSYTKDGAAGSGVIAQELQKVAPELVSDDGEYLSVAYGNTIGYLIEAIKDLKEEVDDLKAKLEDKD